MIATASPQGIVLWDARTGQERRTLKPLADDVAWSPDGKWIAGRIAEGGDRIEHAVGLWNVATGKLEKKIVARVRLIRFKPADVEPLTVSKPIDFFPAA